MNQSEEYYNAFYEYQLKIEQMRKQHQKELTRDALLWYGAIVAFVCLLMFIFLPGFWPWNQI